MNVDEVARERSSAALKATERINGQLVELTREQARTREGLYKEMDGLHEKHNTLAIDVAKVKTRAGIMAALGAGIATAVIAPLLVYVLIITFHLNRAPAPVKDTPAPPAAGRIHQ